MTTIAISTCNVASYPEGGGHFWVYLQYALGFKGLGCDVIWLERFRSSGNRTCDETKIETFQNRLERFGLGGTAVLYTGTNDCDDGSVQFLNCTHAGAHKTFKRASLLLNFQYDIHPKVLKYFTKTALVDIDPGLLQFWISVGQLEVSEHDLYFTIGETVGTRDAAFPDCDLPWVLIRPPIFLPQWPFVFDPTCNFFTTISGWWGGNGEGEWITDGKEVFFENNKRVSFLKFLRLPQLTSQPFELALAFGDGDPDNVPPKDNARWLPAHLSKEDTTTYTGDQDDLLLLRGNGWNVRHAHKATGSPDAYRAYIQRSRGEFSCVKPSCLFFKNAWVSDRSICYLASGRPVVVQNAGEGTTLPSCDGFLRFTTLDEAVSAIETVNSAYRKSCFAARDLAESVFDSQKVLSGLLNQAL